MTDLAAWTQVAQPHRDIADGTFDESLFAADLGSVSRGRGPDDYVDPRRFCDKTYLTGNLSTVLTRLAQRLSGDESAPSVHRLQTDFGGGKTHTLLAAYHVFGNPDAVAGTSLAQELREQLGGREIPAARVAVLDGSDLPVSPEDTGERRLHTLVGHLAWRLGGADSYDLIAATDEARGGSTTHELARLLEAHAPVLILLDEMLVYLNNALSVPTHEGSLAATTLTTIKALTQAAAQVPGVAVLATLTSSNMEDYAQIAGQDMFERLSKVVGRTENIVTPVDGDDIFPILQRRLFASVGELAQRREAADAYGDLYHRLDDVLPASYRERDYRERIAAAYPFHPELVDLCTNRWGSLSGFQRTRGALRILAHTVKALWRADHAAPLIHLGDLPLDDDAVRAEVLRFAGESYKSALNADIIRPDSRAPQEDKHRGGQAAASHLATGLATAAFANSFGAEKVLGASTAQLIVGVARPGVSRGILDDLRDALEAKLHYMRYEGGRYRFTTEPNLNKVIVEREAAVHDYDIGKLVDTALEQAAPSGEGFHVIRGVAEPTDIPDSSKLTLGVVDPSIRLGSGDGDDTTRQTASAILKRKGAGWRANLNAVVLVVADDRALREARATARTLAAMRDLLEDRYRIARFNNEQKERLVKRASDAEQRLPQQLVMAYRNLVAPRDANGEGVRIDIDDLGPAKADATITSRVASYLTDADRLTSKLGPAALLSPRFAVLPEGDDAVGLDRLLDYFSQHPRLPKLADDDVLRSALVAGVAGGNFALASGSNWEADDALLRFGVSVDPDEIIFQPGIWLVRAAAAKAILARRTDDAEPPPVAPRPDTPTTVCGTGPPPPGQPPSGPPGPPTTPPTPDALDDETTDGQGDDATSTALPGVTVTIRSVPADKMRDVLKAAVLSLATKADVTVDMTITATGDGDGIPRDTVELTVAEALRQLELDSTIHEHDQSGD